jgi:hypothetical protein
MAMQVEYNPSTGEATVLDRGNGGHTISSESIGRMNEYNGEFEFQQLEESDPSYREQFSDRHNSLAEVDEFALASAFALAGGESLVREAIQTASQWLTDPEIDRFDALVQEAFDAGELSALEDVFKSLVHQYREAQGYNNTETERISEDAFDPETVSFDPDEDYTPSEELQDEADDFVNSLTEGDVQRALDIWENTSELHAQRAIEFAAGFPSSHPLRLAAAALAHATTSNDDPKEIFDELCEMIGGSVALASFAQILQHA